MKEVQGMCNYCGTGCSVIFHVNDENKIEKLSGAPLYPVNKGLLCPKSFKAAEYINSEDRENITPLIRDEKGGERRPASWDESISLMTRKIKEIQDKYGKKSVAYLSTGQFFVEDFAILGMLRGIMGIEGDGNTRLCMASAVMAYKQAFGFDSPPFTYADIEKADNVILIGSNPAVGHPIVFNRMLKGNPDHSIVVIDPRKSETAQKATLHLPIKPKKDLTFLYMVANELLRRDKRIDHEYVAKHTNHFEAFKEFVLPFDPSQVEEETGITREQLDQVVELIETKEKTVFVWTMGTNQSHEGTRVNQAMINICLMTGNIGKEGTGPCSLTGQTNAMGSRIFSNTTSLFGGRDFANPEHRKQVCDILGVDDDMIPDSVTMPYGDIIDGIEKGSIKVLWVCATNPIFSFMNSNRTLEAFRNLELLVVQDLFSDTETSQHADIFLPAVTMGEKPGFLINSERRMMYSPQVAKRPGEALSDYEICLKIWESWIKEEKTDTKEVKEKKETLKKAMAKWKDQAACFQTLKELSAGTPCDFTGVRDHEFLREKQGVQWPLPAGQDLEVASQRRLFEDGQFFTPNGKANFIFDPPREEANKVSAEYPVYMMTGRGSIAQFHSMTRTARCPSLNKFWDPYKPYFEVSSQTAQKYGFQNGDQVKITSEFGELIASAKVGEDWFVEDNIFIPFHFQGVNKLVNAGFDPTSKQPSFKSGAVKLEKIG